VHQQLDEAAGDAGLDNSLDLIVGTVRKIADRPGVNKNLIIEGVDKLGEDREGRRDLKHEC